MRGRPVLTWWHPAPLGKLAGDHLKYKLKSVTRKRSEGTWLSPRVWEEVQVQLSAGPEEGLPR